MIKQSELRIGNYVSEYNKHVVVTENTFKNWSNLNLQHFFNPIPLTEELISNICLNENKVMGMYRLQATDNYCISFSIDNDMIYIGDDIEIKISDTPMHKLQNLYFALTGEELPIKN